MTAVATALPVVATAEVSAATVQWRRRVLRISSLCEIAFGTLWFANATRAVVPVASALVLLLGAGAFAAAIRATRGTAPRPSAPGARALERRITIATVAQVVVSAVVPLALVATGHGSLVMPVVVVSVGVLFVWLHRLLAAPRLGFLGGALIVVPVVALVTFSGSAAVTVMLFATGTLMLATAAAGVREITRRT